MKVVAILLCVCVTASLGTVVPQGAVVRGAVAGVGKLDAGKAHAGEKLNDVRQNVAARQDWSNKDVKKSRTAQEYQERNTKAASEESAKAQDYGKASAENSQHKEAANKLAAKTGTSIADKEAHQRRGQSNHFGHRNKYDDNSGFRKGNKRHEGISYSFDKKYGRNDNENGGYNAGSRLLDRALDNYGDQTAAYQRLENDDAARAGNAARQNADRASRFGNNAYALRAAADAFGRDSHQAARGRGIRRDHSDKADNAYNNNRYHEDDLARGYDALRDQALVDRNTNRNSVGYGAGREGKGVYAPGYGYGGHSQYGHAAKGVGVIGKGVDRAVGAANHASIDDNALRNKQRRMLGNVHEANAKDSALANNEHKAQLQGYDKKQAADLYDKGYSSDRAGRNEGANAFNRQGADANNAHAASRHSHDFDLVNKQQANNKFKQSDRNHKRDEYKKFFNNDQKGGQNWERLKFNRDRTDDAAAADFANRVGSSDRTQGTSRLDAHGQAARNIDTARANDATSRLYGQKGSKAAKGSDRKAAYAADAANKGVWGADSARRKYAVEQAGSDVQDHNQQARNRGLAREGLDARRLGGAQNILGAAGAANVNYAAPAGYGYNYGYPQNYGYNYGPQNYGYNRGYPVNYGANFGPRAAGGYGYGYPQTGHGYSNYKY